MIAVLGVCVGMLAVGLVTERERISTLIAAVADRLGTELVSRDPARSAVAMPVCRSSSTQTCVIDGDTIRLYGESIRLQSLDAPELFSPSCHAERQLAELATYRLSELLSGAPFEVVRGDKDRYGRTLARLRTEDGWVGSRLVEDGLAQWWDNSRGWC